MRRIAGRAALVVEDNIVAREVVAATLASMDFEVATASDGAIAQIMLAQSAAAPYSLIVSDWNMGVVDGLTLLSFVRAEPALSHTPFLMLTAVSRTEQQAAARRAGADAYLLKPFKPDDLRRKVRSLQGRWEAHLVA